MHIFIIVCAINENKSRGKESSRKLPEKLTERVVYLYQQKYQGFGPTLFSEKLAELEDIHISDETARKWLIEAGQWKNSECKGYMLTHRKQRAAIERLFKTLQDRLIKEMRLKGIKSIEEANKFLKTYIPKYNKKFSLKAHNPEDLHIPVPDGIDLDAILCIKTGRTVRNDNTISYQKELYQIEVMA